MQHGSAVRPPAIPYNKIDISFAYIFYNTYSAYTILAASHK